MGKPAKQKGSKKVLSADEVMRLATGNADIRHAASSSSKESANGSSIAAAIEPARTSSPTPMIQAKVPPGAAQVAQAA